LRGEYACMKKIEGKWEILVAMKMKKYYND
jgi:hypothetical protein